VTVKAISPRSSPALRKEDHAMELIDVRTPAEYREVHFDVAQSAPLDHLDPAALKKARGERLCA